MDKGKRARVDETEEDELDIDPEVADAIQQLQEVQDQLEKVNEEASDAVLEVEQRFNKVRRPLYDTRGAVIASISDFWLTAWLSHPMLGTLLSEEDQMVFKHLDAISVEEFSDIKSGYQIIFTWHENPYFEDKQLSKVFKFSDDGTVSVSGTQPKWKPGMDLTARQGEPEKTNGRKRRQEERECSFFVWFSETMQTDVFLEGPDRVAEVIKDDLWTNPLKYFTQDGEEDEGFEEETSHDDDGDEDEDGEEDEEEDDDDQNGVMGVAGL
eukprot:TRINITY_DN19860_c0_g1_i1.p1 TRINITY_DN19860_c0_g1~~TRINITY_DN19860_c0_g1_i1.p1  ORF type:complete len:268 (-),score=89.41 TRINITY_DN19860_c0_g1_i1:403-1206(-)